MNGHGTAAEYRRTENSKSGPTTVCRTVDKRKTFILSMEHKLMNKNKQTMMMMIIIKKVFLQ
jgi:hypothetical protein